MTVRETLDFSARCQGTGSRADIMKEVNKREKQAGIIPEADIDTYMKAISVEGLKRTLQTDYILKILGLDTCADTIVGDAMNRGISGEMIVGPTRALFMDEISNGLDSFTTFQIVTCLQQFTHITDSTILVSLLQPAPESFDLFDDIILMAEGKIAYHGPRSYVLEFFEHCGFKCPPRKGVADFLQEVVSKKDQAQYWYHIHLPYSYVSVDKFVFKFQEFHVGQKLGDELSRKWELLKACLAREWLLMKRNSFVHVFKSAQLVVIALITMTMFIRTQMKIDAIYANFYMGSLFYALVRLLTNGFTELAMTVSRLPIFYKQSDFYSYPAWACSLPSIILKVPFSMPGILTALMGVSGAGKTTLMDVLSGRKTGGTIEGEIRVGGYPKAFVQEALQLIELDEISNALVGVPRISGISNEQLKRLTIAVELVSNPSIIFMDEPTSGLDARAAAIVMRVVKNIFHTKRTVVCTIRQPSIDIFEAFDEVMK
ncbi:hypothetical protein QYF36_026489 [Acer negundo]|nr:hypothetical protein QYF36_026489 [Acer negundo]